MPLSDIDVCVLTLEYPPQVYGGVGVHVDNLTRYLSKYVKLEVRTICVKGTPSHELRNGIIIKRYDAWDQLLDHCPSSYIPVFKALSLGLNIVSDRVDSKIVHVHTWYMGFAGLLSKELYNVKLVATVHSLEPKRPWKREVLREAYNVSLWAEKTCLKNCDAIIAVSMETKRNIISLYGIEENRIHVIHNGIDEEIWRPARNPRILEKYGIKEPYILFVGRLSRQKGILTLIKAAKNLPSDLTIVLVTGKPDNPNLIMEVSRAVKDLKNVVWINKVLKREELIPLYTMALAFICPSIYEPFGIVNLEAMACETPVIASNVGGIPEAVVDGETGILVTPGNHIELAEAITRLYNNWGMAREMGIRARKRVLEKFTWSIVARKTYNLYMEVLGSQ